MFSSEFIWTLACISAIFASLSNHAVPKPQIVRPIMTHTATFPLSSIFTNAFPNDFAKVFKHVFITELPGLTVKFKEDSCLSSLVRELMLLESCNAWATARRRFFSNSHNAFATSPFIDDLKSAPVILILTSKKSSGKEFRSWYAPEMAFSRRPLKNAGWEQPSNKVDVITSPVIFINVLALICVACRRFD